MPVLGTLDPVAVIRARAHLQNRRLVLFEEQLQAYSDAYRGKVYLKEGERLRHTLRAAPPPPRPGLPATYLAGPGDAAPDRLRDASNVSADAVAAAARYNAAQAAAYTAPPISATVETGQRTPQLDAFLQQLEGLVAAVASAVAAPAVDAASVEAAAKAVSDLLRGAATGVPYSVATTLTSQLDTAAQTARRALPQGPAGQAALSALLTARSTMASFTTNQLRATENVPGTAFMPGPNPNLLEAPAPPAPPAPAAPPAAPAQPPAAGQPPADGQPPGPRPGSDDDDNDDDDNQPPGGGGRRGPGGPLSEARPSGRGTPASTEVAPRSPDSVQTGAGSGNGGNRVGTLTFEAQPAESPAQAARDAGVPANQSVARTVDGVAPVAGLPVSSNLLAPALNGEAPVAVAAVNPPAVGTGVGRVPNGSGGVDQQAVVDGADLLAAQAQKHGDHDLDNAGATQAGAMAGAGQAADAARAKAAAPFVSTTPYSPAPYFEASNSASILSYGSPLPTSWRPQLSGFPPRAAAAAATAVNQDTGRVREAVRALDRAGSLRGQGILATRGGGAYASPAQMRRAQAEINTPTPAVPASGFATGVAAATAVNVPQPLPRQASQPVPPTAAWQRLAPANVAPINGVGARVAGNALGEVRTADEVYRPQHQQPPTPLIKQYQDEVRLLYDGVDLLDPELIPNWSSAESAIAGQYRGLPNKARQAEADLLTRRIDAAAAASVAQAAAAARTEADARAAIRAQARAAVPSAAPATPAGTKRAATVAFTSPPPAASPTSAALAATAPAGIVNLLEGMIDNPKKTGHYQVARTSDLFKEFKAYMREIHNIPSVKGIAAHNEKLREFLVNEKRLSTTVAGKTTIGGGADAGDMRGGGSNSMDVDEGGGGGGSSDDEDTERVSPEKRRRFDQIYGKLG